MKSECPIPPPVPVTQPHAYARRYIDRLIREDDIKRTRHVINLSGGKDSTATLIVAMETISDHSRIIPVFADTGNEHPITYQHVDDLERLTGIPVKRLSADLSGKFEVRRKNLPGNYRQKMAEKRFYRDRGIFYKEDATPAERLEAKAHGQLYRDEILKCPIIEDKITRAMAVMYPSGNQFLDMCLLRGGFPGSVSRKFCTSILKIEPITEFLHGLLDDPEVDHIWQWVGIRRDESPGRKNARRYEIPEIGGNVYMYRPLVDWTAAEVFAAHVRAGVPWNPLYQQGMKRVGCFPCINVGKAELLAIATRFPEFIEKIARWERLVREVSMQGVATFLPASNRMTEAQKEQKLSPDEVWEIGNIYAQVDWAKTSHGGKQFDMFAFTEPATCSSWHGLCE